MSPQNKKTYSVVSLFCGAGGMDLGFEMAGFNILWASDKDKDALKTYKKNFENIEVVCKDIRDIKADEIPNNPDIIIGGFPCQGFSIAGKRKTDDIRNQLAWEMIRLIREKRPKIFIGENVLGLRSLKDEKGNLYIDHITDDLRTIGYNVAYRVLDARNYGVPQRRKRIFIIGNRLDLKVMFPESTAKDKHEWKTLRDALEGLPNPNETDPDIYSIPNHQYTSLAPSDMEMVKLIPKGKNWKCIDYEDLTERLQKVREKMKEYKSPVYYQRPKWDEPNGTITATMSPTHSCALHPTKNRRFTVRECARIQSFPDDFVFVGSTSSCYKQVGNAVPPRLAYQIAQTVKYQLENREKLKKYMINNYF